jgi:hypothetical protein
MGDLMLDISPEAGARDLVGGTARDWLVTGWFTEDDTYRPLAQRFAANLTEHGAPFHLWAKPKGQGWSTRRKPAVVLETLDAYPGRTVVLVDVDCVVRGDIAPVTQIETDVGIIVIARNMRKGGRFRHWIATECSSRVVVFRPTDGARAFARKWADRIERSEFNHDEHAMIWAMLASLASTSFDYIDQRFSAREIGQIPDAVIEHDSAHDEARRAARGAIKTMLREFERRFLRTGRTRASRLKGEMSVLVKAG